MTSTTAGFDYDALMRANALRVFSETDPVKRLAALAELWAPGGTLFERHPVTGHDAISDSVGALLEHLPPETVFTPVAPAMGHHGVAVLRWAAGVRGASPGPVTGTDVARVEDGKIRELYVFLDPNV